MGQYSVGHPHDTEDVDVEEPLRLGDRILFTGSGKPHAGIVDQDIYPSELGDHRVDCGGDGFVLRDVELDEGHALIVLESGGIAAGADDAVSRVK